jgi:Na+-translocating ferredoxin:NAD+ oxidoreductase subunit B
MFEAKTQNLKTDGWRKQAEQIDQLLPQTQCQRCGFNGCLPYAQAVAQGTPINRCPPGGQALIDQLALLLGRERLPLDPAHGQEQPRRLALIREQDCIGCTLCIPACPVDAIVGGPKRLHTVLIERCTGCELCLPACPVACIEMPLAPATLSGWTAAQQQQARRDYERAQTKRQQTASDHTTAVPTAPAAQTVSQDTHRLAAQLATLALQQALKITHKE